MASEKVTIIDRKDWDRLAKQVLLRPYIKIVLDQDGVGSCATESTTGGTMLVREFRGLSHVLLNPWFIYNTTSGGRDAGSSIDDNLAFAQKYGIAPELVWPRSKGWRATPSAEAKAAALQFRIGEVYDVSTIDEMVSCLLHGYPVVYGAAGHSVLKFQHLNESQGLDLNSWGSDRGDNGCEVWASYRGVNWAYGAFAIRNTVEG